MANTTTIDRLRAILGAASALMAEVGSRGTTIAAVAEQVGMTDAGVLYHFTTKQDLVLAVLEQFDRDAKHDLRLDELSGIEMLRSARTWGAGMELVPQVQSLLVVLTAEHLHADGPVRDYIRRRYRLILARFSEAFAHAAAAGDLRHDLDPELEASALVAHLDGIRLQWFLLDGAVAMGDSVKACVDHTLERLAPSSLAPSSLAPSSLAPSSLAPSHGADR